MTEVLALLILLTVIAAIITVLTSNLLYAVISVGAVGFLLAIGRPGNSRRSRSTISRNIIGPRT